MNRSREYARTLLRKARDDAWMLAQLIGKSEAPDWGLGFHAQQAVEKAIKAVLSDRGVEFPRTHDLAELTELARGAGVSEPPDGADLDLLTPYGAPVRYEVAADVGLERGLDRNWATGVVQRTLSWAQDLLGTKGEGL